MVSRKETASRGRGSAQSDHSTWRLAGGKGAEVFASPGRLNPSSLLKGFGFDLVISQKVFHIRIVVGTMLEAMDFRHLESFCRVAELKSFSKAADALQLTQPTISGHILTLERSLSVRLFDRVARESRLTKAGEILYRYACEILTKRREALNVLSQFSSAIQGELWIGASTLPGEHILPKLLGEFKRDYPNTAISLKIGDTKEIVKSVLEGQVELAIIGGKIAHPSLRYELFGEDEILVVVSRSLWPTKRKTITLDEIAKEPWIFREEGSGTQMAVERVLKKAGRSLKQFHVAMRVGSASAVKEAVKAGLGWAFLSRKVVEEEVRSNTLFHVDVAGLNGITRPIYTVFHRGRTFSPTAERFVRFLGGQGANGDR